MKLIAEIGSNHNGSLGRALELIRAARAAGFDAVKFQAFRVREMFHPLATERHPELLERRRYEIPDDWWGPLSEEAEEQGISFGVTPFGRWQLSVVSPYVGFLKVSSYQLTDVGFVDMVLWQAREIGIPCIVSTGMATLDEVREAVATAHRGQDMALLHCVSLYPTKPEEANLRAIQTLREAFPGVHVGWSDHSMNWRLCRMAQVDYGPSIIEAHFDLDDNLGAETWHSWTPVFIRGLTDSEHSGGRDFRRAPVMIGTGIKAPQPRELKERLWRHDPTDGMRPLKELRERWLAQERP